jgi:hypothetical protein
MVKEYTICFGNIAFPQKNGKFMHLRDERYREILSKFLDSDEGLDYIAPTEEEIEKVRIAVLNREAFVSATRARDELYVTSQWKAYVKVDASNPKNRQEKMNKYLIDSFKAIGTTVTDERISAAFAEYKEKKNKR